MMALAGHWHPKVSHIHTGNAFLGEGCLGEMYIERLVYQLYSYFLEAELRNAESRFFWSFFGFAGAVEWKSVDGCFDSERESKKHGVACTVLMEDGRGLEMCSTYGGA